MIKKSAISNKGEKLRFLIWLLVIGLIVCAVAVYFKVFTEMELPARVFASILGVILTAIVTLLLLNEQGKAQKELLEKQAAGQKDLKWSEKVFEEKMKIYKGFLDSLYKTVVDGALSEQEKMELQFQTSLVAMHCHPENIEKLSAAVRHVIEGTCPQEKRQADANNPDLLKNLFDVVEAFRKDLYDTKLSDGYAPFADDVKTKTIANFKAAYDNAQQGEEEPVVNKSTIDVNILSAPDMVQPHASHNAETLPPAAVSLNKADLWDSQIKLWEADGWVVDADNLKISRKDGFPYWIDLEYWKCACVLNAHSNDNNFSQALKWELGGRRWYGDWYETLPQPFAEMKLEAIRSALESNPDLQQYVIKRVNELQPVLLAQYHTEQWKSALGDVDGWNTWVWYWKNLLCEKAFDGDRKISIWLREAENKEGITVRLKTDGNNVEQWAELVRAIGFSEKQCQPDTCDNTPCFILMTIDESEIEEKVSKLIANIEAYINQLKP